MKQKMLNTLWVMGGPALALFCLFACNRESDVQQSYPFTVEAMSVQKSIAKGETAEICCFLKREGNFAGARYIIRYFRPDGKGTLEINDGTIFQPNDCYPLTKEELRLYYTPFSTDHQVIDIYVEDNHGQLQHLSFDFNHKRTE